MGISVLSLSLHPYIFPPRAGRGNRGSTLWDVHASRRAFRKCARVSRPITKWRRRIRKRYRDRRKGYQETEEEAVEMRIKCRQRNRGCAAACNWIGSLPKESPLPCPPSPASLFGPASLLLPCTTRLHFSLHEAPVHEAAFLGFGGAWRRRRGGAGGSGRLWRPHVGIDSG